jgi:hypothetical protein
MKRLTTLERAYELARAGPSASIGEIKQRLKHEGFEAVEGHLSGPLIMSQLRRLCNERAATR